MQDWSRCQVLFFDNEQLTIHYPLNNLYSLSFYKPVSVFVQDDDKWLDRSEKQWIKGSLLNIGKSDIEIKKHAKQSLSSLTFNNDIN